MVFEQRLKKSNGISPGYIRQESMPGRGDSRYKGPEVGLCQVCLRNTKDGREIRKRRVRFRELRDSGVPEHLGLHGLWERLWVSQWWRLEDTGGFWAKWVSKVRVLSDLLCFGGVILVPCWRIIWNQLKCNSSRLERNGNLVQGASAGDGEQLSIFGRSNQ